MINEHIQPSTFSLPSHTLPGDVRKSLNQLLETFESKLAEDETSIGTTYLAKMQIDMGDSELVSQRPYPIAMKQCDSIRSEMDKLFDAQVIHSSHYSWSVPSIVVAKGDGGKHLVINYRPLNKVTWKFVWPMPRVEDIFSKLNSAKDFSTLNLLAGYHHIPLDEDYSQNRFYISFWKIWISESGFWISTSSGIFPRTEE